MFKQLVNRTPWETALRDKGAKQSWQIFKDTLHRAQELLIPKCKKSAKEGKRPAWLSQDLLVKLKARRKYTGSGSRIRYPGKSVGTLTGCAGMESGRSR